jgi:hypothetical protein
MSIGDRGFQDNYRTAARVRGGKRVGDLVGEIRVPGELMPQDSIVHDEQLAHAGGKWRPCVFPGGLHPRVKRPQAMGCGVLPPGQTCGARRGPGDCSSPRLGSGRDEQALLTVLKTSSRDGLATPRLTQIVEKLKIQG